VHVQALQGQAVGLDLFAGAYQVAMPDAMLAMLATGIGFLGMAMPETWVDA
jgi:hypothetical protein